MRPLDFFATLATVAVQAVQSGHLAVTARDDGCSKLPRLCTDSVLLHGNQTTLTYLCPETRTPTATITVATTVTTTLPGSAPTVETSGYATTPVSNCNENASTSEELTTTTTVHSTRQVTVTKTVASSSSFLTPAVITTSFSAAALSGAEPLSTKPTWSEFKNVSSVTLSISKPVATEQPFTFIDLTSLNLFPPHTVASPSSTAHNSSTIYSMSLSNKTSSFSGYDLPTMNILREVRPTETVTTTTAIVSTTGTGMAGETRISLVTLFLSVMVTVLIL